MERKFMNFYNELKPNGDVDSFVDNVIRKANNMKQGKTNKLSRKAIVSFAVATVVATSALGVGAANNWDYYAVFGNIFGDNAVYVQDYTKEPEYEIIKNTFEDFDFAVSGVLGTNDNLMILIDVTAKNGFEFDDNLLYFLDTNISGWGGGLFGNAPAVMGSSLRTRNETANGFTAMINMNTDSNINGKTLTITANRVGQLEKEIKGELVIKVEIDSDNLPTVTLMPNEYAAVTIRAHLLPEEYSKPQESYADKQSEITAAETTVVSALSDGIPLELKFADTEIFVKNLVLTPISLRLEFERTESEINEEFFFGGDIIPLYLLKAGGEKINLHYDDGGIANGSSMGPMYDNSQIIGYKHTFEFEYPVDLNEIVSVMIGGLEIPLK